MGVKGLLPRLQDIHQAINVRNLDGCTVGIEASSWLYKVLYPCSWELYTKQVTIRYSSFFEEGIEFLLQNNVKPVVVFDGEQIPAKAKTKEQRKKKIQEARRKADIAMQNNDLETAKRAASQAIEITDEIVREIMKVLHKHDVPFVVAPYEADAQLAYMAQIGVIEYVMTEDSDLLVYGAPKVIYKWDRHSGVGCLIEGSELWRVFSFPFTRDIFITMCVLSGCDYLDSLPRIGIKRAEHFIATAGDIFEELDNIGSYNNVKVHVPGTYSEAVKKASMVYKHQIVYDFGTDALCPCTPYPEDLPYPDFGDYAGHISTEGREKVIVQNHLEYVWMSVEDLYISRASDTSWTPAQEDNGEHLESGLDESRYYTRQAGQLHDITSVADIVEWTVPSLPVLTLPLLLGESGGGELTAISLLNDEDLPTVGPFQVFCTSSCYIHYEGQKCLLLWKWHKITVLEHGDQEEEEEEVLSSTDEWEKSSEEEGEDVIVLVEEEEEEEEEEDNTYHTAGFKVLGVTAKNSRQDALHEAKIQMDDGKKVAAILRPEPSNRYDANAIQVVIGVGDRINVVGYIPHELTKYVHEAINSNKIRRVAIQHIHMRVFNPPGWYMRLLITKQGRWHNEVVRKSYQAK